MKLAHSASKRFVERAKAKAEETGDSARRRLDFDNVAEKKNGKTGEGKVDGKGEGKGAKKRQAPEVTDTGFNLVIQNWSSWHGAKPLGSDVRFIGWAPKIARALRPPSPRDVDNLDSIHVPI